MATNRHTASQLWSHREYAHRLLRSGMTAAVMLACMVGLGVLGYHFIVGLDWLDALLNASMILSGMGPVDPVRDPAGKVFASIYAIASGVVFITTMGVFLTPMLHRVLHRYHMETDDKKK